MRQSQKETETHVRDTQRDGKRGRERTIRGTHRETEMTER